MPVQRLPGARTRALPAHLARHHGETFGRLSVPGVSPEIRGTAFTAVGDDCTHVHGFVCALLRGVHDGRHHRRRRCHHDHHRRRCHFQIEHQYGTCYANVLQQVVAAIYGWIAYNARWAHYASKVFRYTRVFRVYFRQSDTRGYSACGDLPLWVQFHNGTSAHTLNLSELETKRLL